MKIAEWMCKSDQTFPDQTFPDAVLYSGFQPFHSPHGPYSSTLLFKVQIYLAMNAPYLVSSLGTSLLVLCYLTLPTEAR